MKIYTKLFIILCLSTIYNFSFAQDMSGEWNGILRQSEGGAAASYYFTLDLKQKGKIITGTSKIAFVQQPEFYAIMQLKGVFKNDILTFKELKIIDQKVYDGLDWCLKSAKLNFTMKKDGFCIEGTWSGLSTGGNVCSPGTLKMCKIVPIAAVPKKESPQPQHLTKVHAAIMSEHQKYFC